MAAYSDPEDRSSNAPYHWHSLCSHRCTPGHRKQQGWHHFTLARPCSCLTAPCNLGHRNHHQLHRLRSAKPGVKPARRGEQPYHSAVLQLPSPFIRVQRPILATTICIHLRAERHLVSPVHRSVRHPIQRFLHHTAILQAH